METEIHPLSNSANPDPLNKILKKISILFGENQQQTADLETGIHPLPNFVNLDPINKIWKEISILLSKRG